MEPFEKLGAFYLGRAYDLTAKKVSDEIVLYDSRDLLTHAFCVGMTGSGKTGLCVSLIEEAAIDGIPAIVIDPKGDLADLMLTFPALSAVDFRPWINEEEAAREGASPDAYAETQAARWREGLASWGQTGERIERLKAAAEFAVYTPGSEAGLPVSILAAFSAPRVEIAADEDLLNERITTAATSLLGLVGIEGDAIKSREHVLISTILEHAWRQGRDLDLASLIQMIQSPPVTRIGVLDVESFYPAKDRFELAAALNNLLASPGFGAWLSGEPLDVDRLLYTAQGKPRVAIFYVAHLSDTERMFFVSLLLNQVLGWARTRPGTTSLRALVYMDEIFGYLPPVAEPPSKRPLLTLLKQARAYGVGVVLATQNPIDIDYKGLSNIGTWLIGRLQTDRDRERLLDGLEGVTEGREGAPGRAAVGDIIGRLDKRVFFMHDVHESAPVVFQSRWAMSYLCGPLTRAQIKTLMAPVKGALHPAGGREGSHVDTVGAAGTAAAPTPATPVRGVADSSAPPVASPAGSAAAPRPVLPPQVPEAFLPLRARPSGGAVVYRPGLLALASVRYVQSRTGPEHLETVAAWLPLAESTNLVDWEKAESVSVSMDELQSDPVSPAEFAALPSGAASAKNFAAWRNSFSGTLIRTHRLEVFWSPRLKLASEPRETERDFRVRLGDSSRENRDDAVEKLRKKNLVRFRALEEKIRRAELAIGREKQQADQENVQTAISLGATVLSAFLGRKSFGRSTLGRATTTARGVERSARQAQDVQRAKAQLETLRAQLAEMQSQFGAEVAQISARFDPATEPLETLALKPRKADIDVKLVTLAWEPCVKSVDGTFTPL